MRPEYKDSRKPGLCPINQSLAETFEGKQKPQALATCLIRHSCLELYLAINVAFLGFAYG